MATPSINKVEAVADTSFLIALQWLDLLPTLTSVYSQVWVAERVWTEFCDGASEMKIATLEAIPVVQKATASNLSLVMAIATVADGGESEAIALAIEKQVHLLLIDDYRGRKVAQQLGLQTRGVLGHLLILKRMGLIGSIYEQITVLQQKGFFLSQSLIDDILRRAGEQ